MSSNIHLVLLVLMVTSRLVTIGSDGIPRRSRNADQQTQVVTQVDANSVVTSAEMQGATPRTEKEVPSQSAKRFMGSSTTTSLPPQSAKELASDHSAEMEESSSGDAPKDKAAEKSVLDPSSTTPSALSSATTRPSRHISGAQNRDSKLMDLLAARRSALQRDRWRTHRRVVTTNRTTIETTSKSPPDSRTTCERNCTKNFTRRTTASCMRRCVSMKRLSNTTETTATPATAKPSARTKVDEKDNNEILLTDESSHGFYVVTKELNDTANHITNGVKVPSTSTEKTYKIRMKGRQPISDEEIDLKPYVFFGQKLPPLKPTVLRITKVSDDHPKILEVSVTRPSERIRSRGRITPRDRNIVASTRRHAFNNFTRGLTTTSTDRPFGLFKESSEERLIKEATLEDDSTVTVLVRSPQRHSARLQMPYGNASSSILGAHNNSNFQVKNFTSVTLILEASSTPLMISVPEEDDPTERPTIEIPISAVGAESVESPTMNTTLPNVVHNVTSPSTIIAHYSSSSLGTIPTESTTTSTSTTPSTTTTTATTTTSTAPTTTTITTKTTTTSTSTTTMPTTASTTTASTTSAAIKAETVTSSSSTIAAPLEPPSDFPSPTTTISSSIRSTVNPISTSTHKPAHIPATNSSTDASLNKTTTVDYFSSTENSTYRTNTSFDFNTPIRQSNQTSKAPAIEGINLTENEVTIEMHRINTATYVMAGLGMLPVAIIILYVGKTVIMKRRFKDDDDLDNYVTDQQPISPVRKMDQCDEERNDQYSIISDQEFDRTNIRFKSLLGEGNFGQVWKAEADDLSGHLGTTRIVAVKTVRAGSSQVGLKEEAEIMRKLGSHPNVVTLLGACVETEPHLLIMEYAMRGRLLSLLRAARSATNILPASVPGGRSLAPLSPRTLAGFSLDIARGMEYISGKKIVHRDLAARNVLLDHNGVCKICDFGMSIDLEAVRKTQPQTRKAETRNLHGFERFRFDIGGRLINQWNHANNNISNNNNSNNNNHNQEKKNHDSISKRPALPIRWMAPEALQYHMFSTETDVWAFGIVLWEIATLGCTPYPNLSGREVVRCVPNGVRPELPKEGRPEFYNLMGRCWHKEPRLRPTFREARIEISRTICKWVDDDTATSDYMDVSGFSEDLEHGMVYFNRRISEFECEI